MKRRHILLAAVAAGVGPGSIAVAQTVGAPSSVAPIEVQALPFGRTQAEIAAPVVELTGDELVFQRRATLGDTLSSLPGINSETFSGGASRPVIRGQSAPRVKVLSDSSEVLDASQISPDHATVAEPLLVNKIEVLRGPSALLYGGGAIGGAVNLIDEKVPTAAPANGFTGVAEARGGTNADERSGVAGVTLGSGPFALRLEGVVRRSDDYEDGDGNRVRGTYSDSDTQTIGASYSGAKGYLGAAYTRQRSDYGIPGHAHEFEDCHPHGVTLHCGAHEGEEEHDHEHEEAGEAAPYIDLKSDRFDLRGEYRQPITGIERIRLRGSYTTYRHDELDAGEVGSIFKNQGWDGRLEVEHSPLSGWRGVFGAQLLRSDSNALGTEAFLPPVDTRNTGVFLLEEYQAGDVRFELAARQEWQRLTPGTLTARTPETKHSPFSASAGAVWTVSPGYSLSLSLSRSQRAPSAQELYASGVHLATSTYELGQADLSKETSKAADLTFRRTQGRTTLTASAFYNQIDGYIFADTLDQVEDFRLIRYSQADARFVGLDGQVAHEINDNISVSVFGDYVRAKLTDDAGNLPRIPAGRLGAHFDYKAGPFTADVEYFHVFTQKKVAHFETATPGYDMVNLTLAYDVPVHGVAGQIYLRGANLLDELALNHASFVKTAAPLPGRTFTLGLRARF
jgi:iron complex outermembrane receptor protein